MYTSVKISEPVRLERIHSFFHHHYAPDYRFPGEMHDFWEIVCVIKGKICVTAGEQIYGLGAGELIIHEPMEFHNFFVDDQGGAQVCIVSFSAQTVPEEELAKKVFCLNEFQLGLIRQMFAYLDDCRAKSDTYKAYRDALTQEPAAWFLPYMYLFEAQPNTAIMAASFVSQLLLTLTDSEGRTRQPASAEAKQFQKVMDHLSGCVDQNITVQEIARQVGMSVSGLSRIFQKFAGISVHRYILMQKIKVATRLLRSGVSVTETSQKLGFSNQSYFSACFKRETGKKPSEIMKK